MDTSLLSLLSDAALQEHSGKTVFARGQIYAGNGSVRVLEETPTSITAQVQGTETYRTRASINRYQQLEAACSCPHANDGYFCKHKVALCLMWRAKLGGAAPIVDEATLRKVTQAAQRAQKKAEQRAALQRFVQEQSAEDLAALVWRWAEKERGLMSDLKAWQAECHAGSNSKALRAVISDLLRPRGGWEGGGDYVDRAERVLSMLKPWLERDAHALRELCEHALRCLTKVPDYIHDEEGELLNLMHDVVELLTQALHAAPPPASWVDQWFKLMDEDPWGVWDEAEILAAGGTVIQERYTERTRADWQRWLHQHPQPSERYDSQRSTLRRRWLNAIALQQDPRALLEAMHSNIRGPHEFHAIVEHCETHGWYREAIQWAQTAAKHHPDVWQTQDDLLRCYERDGWDEEALQIWRKRLEQAPFNTDIYHATLTAAVRAGHERTAYREQFLTWAKAQEKATPLRNVSVRLTWLLADDAVEEALALVQQPAVSCQHQLLEALALRLPEAHYATAVQWLRRAFDALMPSAGSPYTKPLELVHAIAQRLPQEDAVEWLAELRNTYRRKRNFVAGLP